MLDNFKDRKIFFASDAIDFRLSMDGLQRIVERNCDKSNIFDGTIYVFYNKNRDKVKCFFWDLNGYVVYYKRLVGIKFHINKNNDVKSLSYEDLSRFLEGATLQR